MKRKKWTKVEKDTPSIKKLREKRKWQIALRRYAIEGIICPYYAPYFGLEIKKLREWLELQLPEGIRWEGFGKEWQFDHVIPVTFFDFMNEDELRLCWNFLNLRVKPVEEMNHFFNISQVRLYFERLYQESKIQLCKLYLNKLQALENCPEPDIKKQVDFIMLNSNYLQVVNGFNAFEFELLNRGRSLEEVKKEGEFIKGFRLN